MNGAFVHLLLNHVPILGSFFVICLFVMGKYMKSENVIRAALIALVATAIGSIPVYLSGEDAENVVDKITSVNKQAMELHEDMAELAFWALMMNGAIALGTLYAAGKSNKFSSRLIWVNIAFVAIVFLLMARAGWSGGQIRHSEMHLENQ